MDWSLIATWRNSGVPLHVALRGIERAMDSYFSKQPLKDSKPNTLFYCHPSVMEEFAHHLESHVGEAMEESPGAKAPEAAGPDKNAVTDFLGSRILEIKSLLAKHSIVENLAVEGIERIVQRLDEIARDLDSDKQADYEALDRDLAILDESLTQELHTVLPPEQMETWQQEAKRDLKMYRKKLPKETYGKILDNYLRTKIHRHFGVGELSLFQM
jgi:hypothetical protein